MNKGLYGGLQPPHYTQDMFSGDGSINSWNNQASINYGGSAGSMITAYPYTYMGQNQLTGLAENYKYTFVGDKSVRGTMNIVGAGPDYNPGAVAGTDYNVNLLMVGDYGNVPIMSVGLTNGTNNYDPNSAGMTVWSGVFQEVLGLHPTAGFRSYNASVMEGSTIATSSSGFALPAKAAIAFLFTRANGTQVWVPAFIV